MKTFSTFLGMIFGLAFLAAFLASGYFLFKYIHNVFDTLNPQVKAIAAIASVVALLCAMIIAGGLKAPNPKEDLSSTTAEKVNIYQPLLSLSRQQLKNLTEDHERIADGELIKLEQRLALHGSSKVIKAYVNFRRATTQEVNTGTGTPTLLHKLVLEMRADLGQTDFNLKESDLHDLLRGQD
jgi:hypothetical protein